MRIVCKRTILMSYHTLFFSKIKIDVENLSSAEVLIGALRDKTLAFGSRKKLLPPAYQDHPELYFAVCRQKGGQFSCTMYTYSQDFMSVL